MTEFTPQAAGRVARVALFTEWLRQIEAGELTEAGLRQIRGRIDPVQNEFEPGAGLDALRWAVASALGVEPGDMPDMEPPPDFPPEDLRPRW
jgi:hypothetical protein